MRKTLRIRHRRDSCQPSPALPDLHIPHTLISSRPYIPHIYHHMMACSYSYCRWVNDSSTLTLYTVKIGDTNNQEYTRITDQKSTKVLARRHYQLLLYIRIIVHRSSTVYELVPARSTAVHLPAIKSTISIRSKYLHGRLDKGHTSVKNVLCAICGSRDMVNFSYFLQRRCFIPAPIGQYAE